MCRRDSGSKQKEQFDVEDKFHLARLEFVGKALLMYNNNNDNTNLYAGIYTSTRNAVINVYHG